MNDSIRACRWIAAPIAATAMLTASAGLVSPPVVAATTIEVTTVAPSGPGSFAQAVADANSDADADTVTFAAGLSGQIALTSPVSIDAPASIIGNDAVTLTNASGDVLEITNASNVSISNVTVADAAGVGIKATKAGMLRLSGVTIADNTGDGIRIDNAIETGISDSTITGNQSIGISGAGGGNLSIDGSTITSNGGEGINIQANSDAHDVWVINTTLANNGNAQLYARSFTQPLILDPMGDPAITGNVRIERSVLTGSSVAMLLEPTHDDQGGPARTPAVLGAVTIDRSTLVSSAGAAIPLGDFNGESARGGLFIEQSTIDAATNAITSQVDHSGGLKTPVTIMSSTVIADGGYALDTYEVSTVSNSVLIGDIEVQNTTATYTAVPTGSALTGPGVIEVDDPLLGPLADNGGPTVTRLPQATSPLIDAGDPNYNGPAADQRGQPRIVGGRIDIGSVEYAPPPDPDPDPDPNPDPDPGTGAGTDPTQNPEVPAADVIVAIAPIRVLDTRDDAPVAAGTTRTTPVADHGDIPDDATGVVANLTAIDPDQRGYATLYPCGTVPNASHLNYGAGDVVANNVIVPLNSSGELCLFSLERSDYAIDINGYVPADSPLELFEPARFADTRPDATTLDGEGSGGGPNISGGNTEIQISGRNGVPNNAATAIVNVTAVNPDAAGFVSMYPCSGVPDQSSTVNYLAGQTVPNGAIVALSPTGTVCAYSLTDVDVVVDVAGYLDAGVSGAATAAPQRLVDTRGAATTDQLNRNDTPIAAGQTLQIQVAGRAGIPDDAIAAMLNVAIVDPAAPGFVTLWPCGDRPTTSNLNYLDATVARANNAITKLSADGKVCIFSLAETDLVLDVNGHIS